MMETKKIWHTGKEIPNGKDKYIIKWKDHNSYKLVTSEEYVTCRLENPQYMCAIERWAYIKDFETGCEAPQQNDIDWEQRRYEIAKAAMVGNLGAPVIEGIDPNPSAAELARHCVMLADALIEELKTQKFL